MQIRMTQGLTYQRLRDGLRGHFAQMAQAQEQLSTGTRLNRPSDDPVGTSRLLGLKSHLALVEGQRESVATTRPVVETAASALQQASDLMSEARGAVLGALNGTTGPEARQALADQLRGIRDALFSVANTRYGNQYVFGGSSTEPPFVRGGGAARVTYEGSAATDQIVVGNGQTVEATIDGRAIFGMDEPRGPSFAGLTGVSAGVSPSDGFGYVELDVRHDATLGALGAGLTFVAGGANDTILGDKTLVVDAAAGTVQLGSGPVVPLPPAGGPGAADVALRDMDGSELHLDFSAYNGSNFSGTVSGAGSISLDGTTYVPLDFLNDDLELTDGAGRILHVDTRDIGRAGLELVTFGGTLNVFDVFDGLIADLSSSEALPAGALQQRLEGRLGDFDAAAESVRLGLGELGARASRLDAADSRLAEVGLGLQGAASRVEDTDIIEAVSQLGQAEQSLQVAQAAGARVLQQSLLNYL